MHFTVPSQRTSSSSAVVGEPSLSGADLLIQISIGGISVGLLESTCHLASNTVGYLLDANVE